MVHAPCRVLEQNLGGLVPGPQKVMYLSWYVLVTVFHYVFTAHKGTRVWGRWG